MKANKRRGNAGNLTDEARAKSAKVRTANARNDVNWQRAAAYAIVRRNQDATYRDIADELNKLGYVTRTGRTYYASTVLRLCVRYSRKARRKAKP